MKDDSGSNNESHGRVSRRGLLKSGAVVAGAALTGISPSLPALAQENESETPGSTNIVHGKLPPIEETRVGELEGLIVPTRNFYVRNHFATPVVERATWSLRVDGHVERPFALNYDELLNLPGRKSLIAFLECAGNTRGSFEPTATGTQWGNGAVGTAEWTGVPLSILLDRAGVLSGAMNLVSQGSEVAPVERGLPIEVAYNPDTMVVWAMNGEPLSAPHGAPVRLFVPGWVGVASTKWLRRLEVTNQPYDGIYNSPRYTFTSRPNGEPDEPATIQPVKSFINRPGPGSTVGAGQSLITGYAWSGYAPIRRVEVTTDGQNWADARILEPRLPRAWVQFEYAASLPPGRHSLASRATDESGNLQPASVVWNSQGYHYNAIYSFEVVAS